MSRKLQKLINYHTSGSTSMPTSGDVALGEIVVRHNNEKPELLIKKNDESFATFIDSGAVENAITLVKTTVEGQIDAFSATVVSDYATKVDAQGYATTAKDEAIGAASAYTDGEITNLNSELTASIAGVENKVDTLIGSDSGKTTRSIAAEEVAKVVANADADFDTLKEIADWIQNDTTGAAKMANDIEALKKADGELSKNIETVDGRVTTLNNSFTAYQETVASTYATKTGVTADIATAKSEAIATAKTYTDGEITKLNSELTKDITDLDGRIDTLEALTGTTNSAIQKIEVSGITGVDVVADGTTRTLDFTDMVIDCGDF